MSTPVSSLTQAEIDQVVRAEFHAAWGRAAASPDYDKSAWNYVQRHLDPVYRNQQPALAGDSQ